MADVSADLIQSHPVFSGLAESAKKHLVDTAILKCYQARETLAHAGERWPYLFLVADGRVAAVKESLEGRSLIVTEVSKGELFWGLAFFHEQVENPVTFLCHQPSTIYLWSRERLLPLLLENGSLAWELSRLMINRMLQASDVIERLAFQPVAGRLARLLLQQVPPGRQSVERQLTLDEMAARAGTTREMVCRALYRFAEEGAIRISRTEFEFLDRHILEKMAGR